MECFVNIAKQAQNLGIISGESLAIDSTKINSYEKATKILDKFIND